MRRYNSRKSFSSDMPLWIELSDPKAFFLYFKNFDYKNVILFCDDTYAINYEAVREYCLSQKWNCSADENMRGSEATVAILYDLDTFEYEQLTRAKQTLIIVTICGMERYFFLFFTSLFCFL